MTETITLHYHRPPDRTDVFVQELLYADDDVLVSYNAQTPLKRPFVVNGSVALEDGSPAIWFTFPGLMHDIGRFHTRDGTFTGLYANIMLPVELHSRHEWSATDLFLDVWIGEGENALIIDREEWAEAVERGWLTRDVAERADAEAHRIVEMHQQGMWPPAIVNEWPISRVRKDP